MNISAIVVTFNPQIELLICQYKSLCNQVDNIIYVDNGSFNFEEYSKVIKCLSSKDNIEIIHNVTNMGLGYAHNQGILLSKKMGASFVVILDHDSVLLPNFVNALYSAYKVLSFQNVLIGAVGPIYFNPVTEEKYPITRYWGPFIRRVSPLIESVEASVLISSGTLISLDVLDKIGGMNEDLFVDYIDIEWSYRARYNGYKLFAVPAAMMNHQIGDRRISILGRMVSVHSPLRRYYLSRNSIYMLKCPYVDWGYKLRELTFNFLRMLIFALVSDDRLRYIKYSFKGICDGFKGKFGKCSIIIRDENSSDNNPK